ncbi:sister chromatid cohesion 1 protein 3 [Rutidosis leptorrhynchoides]|uniref:sister chromatid cohesion 1 protein 3 n=1 Tax=Rutidosis leptorrhynchoides TaxID=125765 RepID=UPI003A995BD0
MFYSHNLLAKKGPLGTVWCAAHLQNRLKKSNYITINIPSTVEQIMYPQVPIALRMSGHLLLGVVRIYSKKVEYLQHDYNALSIDLSKAYAYADINLPQDANQAKFESITLPDNFALDLMDIDEYDPNRSPDSHLRRNEDISFADDSPVRISKKVDQTPSGYIRIAVGEDAPNTPSPSGDVSGPRLIAVEENLHTPPPTMEDARDHVIDDQMESNDTFRNEDNLPSPEYQREADNGGNSYMTTPFKLILPETVEPDLELELQLTKEKGIGSSNLDEILDHGGPPSPPPIQTQPQKSAHSEPEPEVFQDMSDPHVSYGLAPSPPPVEPVVAPEQPRVKRRRIKYDKATVLTNEFMKKSIDDPSDLKRKRKGVSSFLGVWKRNNAYKKEKVLFDPLITGLCDNHCQMFEDGYVSSKPNLINTEEPNPDAAEVNRSAGFGDPTEEPTPDAMEIGRSAAFVDPNDNMLPNMSPDNRSFNSPRTEAENTPAISSDIGSKMYQAQTTVGTGIGSTPDPTSSMGSFVSETETPFPFSESHQGFNNSGGLSDIPEVDDAGELACLEDDEATPGKLSLRDTPNSSGQRRSPPDSGSLLPRTRAVAQYIKEKSTATPNSENVGSVSMKSILQGKTRKVCSRFFFETLVLKTCDLVDVKQDEPYGDVTLKVTPKLSKLHFSN